MSAAQRLVLVTGASRGIGRAAAVALARDGAHVICTARAQRALESLDDEIKAAGGAATLVPLDLKDLDGIDRLGGALYERFGKLDGLLACAGVLGPLTPSFQAAPRVMDEVIGVNLIANQRLIRAMHPLLRLSDAGRVAFVSSSVARAPRAYWGIYAASKAGLEALALAYAAEVAITPIKVNLFNPGATRTAMRAKAYPGEDPMSLPAPEDVVSPLVDLLRAEETRHGELVQFRG
ncbi:MAG: SDR family NAD(P)-dependent oxidoreductase [Alphaproteobacteria bacterium]|nr:SDR family NAD(P)-dependent oxidoreductase [Alphaproteobacteria bacterium]